jgi:PAS domain S-box-containing protein
MMRTGSRTLPWAILLAVLFAAVVLYFASMLDVIGRISEDRDDLERLSRIWLETELSLAEIPDMAARSQDSISSVASFQSQLDRILDLPWFRVLHRAYPQMRIRSDTLRLAVSDLHQGSGSLPGNWTEFRRKAETIEQDIASLLTWIGLYREEQMRAFRVLLVFLAAATILGSFGLLGFGNLLRIQEARFLTAMDSMRDAVILTDAKEEIVYVNPAARSLIASNGAQPNDRSIPPALRNRLPASEPPQENTDISLMDSDGRPRAVRVDVEDIRETSGRKLGSVYVVRDLTEWRKLVASIASAFAHLQMADADDAVNRALDQAASLCGAEMRALVLSRDADIGAPGFHGPGAATAQGFSPGVMQWVREAAAGGATVVLGRKTAAARDAELLSKESFAWVAAVPLRFAGAVEGAIALASRTGSGEIPEREQAVIRVLGALIVELLTKRWAMGEMNRLGAEYRELIESATVPIWGVDLELKVNEWNEAVARLTGRVKSDVVGVAALSLFDPGRTSTSFEGLMSAVVARDPVAEQELRITAASGASCTLLVSGSPRLDFAGRVTGAIFIAQDITARISAEQRIKEQAHALVSVLEIERLRISRDLHDSVAQDLSAARIGCETLFDGAIGAEDVLREKMARITVPISAALESIRTIAYDLRPTEQGSGGLPAALGRICTSFRESHDLEVLFQASGTDHISLEPESSATICRIVQEALSNAARHSGARRVDVTLVFSHPDLILRIVDDGVGFDVEKSFEEATDRRRMGLLGLRERAAILGAALGIVSRPGKGTQIRLTLPVAVAEAAS